MFEPIIQDFVSAVKDMDSPSFCKHLRTPVLVAETDREGFAFQEATTEMFQVGTAGKPKNKKSRLSTKLPVIELRKENPGTVDQFNIGRSEENDLVILDETVSARHVTLFLHHDGSVLVQDLGSTNGTSINGHNLLEGKAIELHDGDLISIGISRYLFFTPLGLYDAISASLPTKPA